MTIKKRFISLFFIDSLILLSSIYACYLFLYPYASVLSNEMLFISTVTLFIAYHSFAWHFGLYRKVWSYASVDELKSIVVAVSLTIFVAMIMQYAYSSQLYIRTLMLSWMLLVFFIGASRISLRILQEGKIKKKAILTSRTMVVGAGQGGRMIARHMKQNPEWGRNPVIFADDDKTQWGLEINGIEVVGSLERIPEFVADHKIDQIVIAIPSLSKKEMAELTKMCIDTGAKTQTLPRIEDLMTGKIKVSDIRDVKIEDLLGREEVKLDMAAIEEQVQGKTVMVTGAGGSIGSEICRQISNFNPSRLLLLGHGENSIYTIDMELRRKVPKTTEIIPIIADVQDRERIFQAVNQFRPDMIYHAAAHKHVPLMEANPLEAVKNNVFGTKNIAEAADKYGVGSFVMISTDKAVNPPNIMGATKRFAEMIVQNLAINSKTTFSAVRFGNVLGSRGSVVPLFKEQIAKGGPITITDPEMTRYFMTIPEASRLVIQAGLLASGGEVFVLDMGEPVKIVDLARNLIKLSGYEENEIKIQFTGMRPGEKLYEELLDASEIQEEKIFPKIYIGKSTPIGQVEMLKVIKQLPEMDAEETKEVLLKLANRKRPEPEWQDGWKVEAKGEYA
ncbi:NDP-sugar epimerase, includes UDP-GlcNAc-inverting 4,6-dehydratase FlaA1 and capsular polysaccharide biosynthesis protein EpsC [Planococcus glaciei]|uniref:polysaccharide biosynthesis protein n=1 Tax=Planococcus glaciei TaxID=459472 RepID=UPI000881ED2B|nr:nucleoside-diphosphate sugar epimerase/dehydratase [Planococcus glaciei]SDI27918.1 NDP-sugar epimerase, includes UDP-GlcNAc-inverting 4,6-dehydratase FlaA1 and capsular polysaccharide biosynthesis protein EpsC [Planococcus glaciei]